MDDAYSLVTGANRGLGLALVERMLTRGDRVVAACRQPGRATALNTLAGEHPGRLHVLPLDVAVAKSIAALVDELSLVDPDLRLRLLINCAGVLHSGERFGSLSAEVLEDSLRVNAVGPLLLTQALAPWLADGARVANITSELGSIGDVHRFGSPSYAVSKAAQNMATAQLAQALSARGIVVLALHPGWVRTDMGGDNATVEPDASAVGLLRVIDAATPTQSGGFMDWRGEPLAW